MKTLVSFYFVFFILLFISCSSDDDNQISPISQDPEIISFSRITSNRDLSDNSEIFKRTHIGDISNNKFQKFTEQIFVQGDLNSTKNIDYFTYQNNQVKKVNSIGGSSNYNFHYQNDKLIGFDIVSTYNNQVSIKTFKISEINSTKYEIDWIDSTIQDDNASTLVSYILVFDENDNVIEAGKDENLDNDIDSRYKNTFTYQNSDLTQVNFFDGSSHNINYTDIKNTRTFLLDNSYGKKTARLLYVQVYCSYFGNFIDNIVGLEHSEHISTINSNNKIYEIHESGFFSKETWIEQSEINNNIEAEYENTYTFQ